jgi:hypothetical protein
MNEKRKNLFFIKCITLSIILLSSVSIASSFVLPKGFQITVQTDHPQYYQEEQVTISGQVLENGTGMPYASVCVSVNDSNGVSVFGTCMLTGANGTFTLHFSLAVDAVLGVYNVTADNLELPAIGYANFEVVSTEVTAEAHGPYTGVVGTLVQFQGSASGGKQPYSWSWAFGDNETSDDQNPDHSYTHPGTYTTQLTVTDSDTHQGTDTAQVIISAVNHAPDAPTITGPTEGKRGVTYSYNVSTVDSDNDTVLYHIDWGDGQTTTTDFTTSGQLVSVQHTWTKKGTYTVRVQAVDEHTAESSWTTLQVTMPTTYVYHNSAFFHLLIHFFETLLNRFTL